jgi:RecG-like helicase
MDILSQDIKFLPGVGPNRKKMLSNELGIETYGDLLEYYPYKYVDRSKVYTIHELTGDMPFVQVVGRIMSFETFPMGPRKERVVAHFTDGTAICDLTWFNGGKYAKQNYKVGIDYLVFGKPTVFNNRINFTHPDLDDASKAKAEEIINEGNEIINDETDNATLHNPENEYSFDFIHNDEEAVAYIDAYNKKNKVSGRIPQKHDAIVMRLAVIYADENKPIEK